MPYDLYGEYWGGAGEASGSAQCSGAVTAAFHWIPDYSGDTAPQSVIVTIESQAYWVAEGNFDGADGEAMDGQDDPESSYVNFGGEWGFGNSQGTHYKIKGGADFNVTIAPSAHMTGGDNNVAGVFVKVSISPVVIGLSGTSLETTLTSQRKEDILIGQGCTAALSGASFTSYSWSVPGDKVGGFHAAPNSGVVSLDKSGGPLPLDPYFTTQANPHWYWKTEMGSPVAITCSAEAFVGSEDIGAVTAIKEVTILAPTTDLSYYIGDVKVQNDMLGLFGGGQYGPFFWPTTNGMDFNGWATTPMQYLFGGCGITCFAQIVTGISIGFADENGNQFHSSTNGQTGIDTGGLNEWKLGGLIGTADGSWLANGDSPSIGLPSTMVSASEVFSADTWFMCQPPGGDSIWVPLWKFSWAWSGTAARTNTSSPWGLTTSTKTTTGENYEPDYPVWVGLAPAGGGSIEQGP